MSVVKKEMKNGLIIATEAMPCVRSISLGVWVRVGSRHESATGISHFIEHLLFKGTKSRSAVNELLERLDSPLHWIQWGIQGRRLLFAICLLAASVITVSLGEPLRWLAYIITLVIYIAFIVMLEIISRLDVRYSTVGWRAVRTQAHLFFVTLLYAFSQRTASCLHVVLVLDNQCIRCLSRPVGHYDRLRGSLLGSSSFYNCRLTI